MKLGWGGASVAVGEDLRLFCFLKDLLRLRSLSLALFFVACICFSSSLNVDFKKIFICTSSKIKYSF